MAIKYRVRTKTDKITSQNKPKYYAVPVYSGEINLRTIAQDLSTQSSLTIGDVYATLLGMIPIIEQYLHNGYSVRLDQLGIFTISVSSDGFEDPKECLPHKVKAKKICFRADASLKKNLKFVKFKHDKK
jgi:predicted histone-like DNA-binding protein